MTDGSQEDDNPTLHIVAAFLLFDGRNNQNDATFEMMHDEGVFPRLIELIQSESVQEEPQLHRMFLELLYESSRIVRLKYEDFSMLLSWQENVQTATSRTDGWDSGY